MNPARINRVTTAAVVAATFLTFGVPMHASTASANLSVSATVANNCTISTNAISFGAYDPIVTNASANLDSTGSVVVTCTKGATTTIGLDTGSNASGGARRLASSGSYLTYELYQDSSRSTVWSDSGSGLLSVVAAPSKAARTYSVYARLTGGQDVPAGTYTDTVVATINF